MCKYSASSGIVVHSSKSLHELKIELNWPIKSPFRRLYFIMKIRLFRVRMIKQFEFLIFDTIGQLIELIWTRQQIKLIFRATTISPCHTMMATFGFSKWIAIIVLKEFETDTNIITQERNYLFTMVPLISWFSEESKFYFCESDGCSLVIKQWESVWSYFGFRKLGSKSFHLANSTFLFSWLRISKNMTSYGCQIPAKQYKYCLIIAQNFA